MLNYPLNNRGKNSWVKIKFEDKNLYQSQKEKLYHSLHIEPIIIAGEWKIVLGNSKHHSECNDTKKNSNLLCGNKINEIFFADYKAALLISLNCFGNSRRCSLLIFRVNISNTRDFSRFTKIMEKISKDVFWLSL